MLSVCRCERQIEQKLFAFNVINYVYPIVAVCGCAQLRAVFMSL